MLLTNSELEPTHLAGPVSIVFCLLHCFRDLFHEYMYVPECVYVTMYIQGLQRPEDSIRFPRTGVTEGCELTNMAAGN